MPHYNLGAHFTLLNFFVDAIISRASLNKQMHGTPNKHTFKYVKLSCT